MKEQIPRRTDGAVYLSVEERFCWREILLDTVGRKFYQTQLEKGYPEGTFTIEAISA